jgi:hypothetical protein
MFRLPVRALILAAVAAGLVAVVASSNPRSAQPAPPEAGPPDSHNRVQVDRIGSAMSAEFGVLRREQRAEDRVPAATADMAAHPAPEANGAVPERGTTNQGVNPELARRVAASADGEVFLLPGDTGMCLATVRSAVFSGITCATSEHVIARGLYFSQAATPEGGRRVEGVVPDGVSAVRIAVSGVAPETRKVADNGFSIDVMAGEPTSVTWLDDQGAPLKEEPLP